MYMLSGAPFRAADREGRLVTDRSGETVRLSQCIQPLPQCSMLSAAGSVRGLQCPAIAAAASVRAGQLMSYGGGRGLLAWQLALLHCRCG